MNVSSESIFLGDSTKLADSDEGPDPMEMRQRVRRGIALCRRRELEEGYRILRSVTQEVSPTRDLPGPFFSYLGYGIAALESRYNDGIALCERAIEMEFYNPENHLNLARTYMLLGARRKTVQAIRAGLKVDPDDRALRLLKKELGVRKRPFLSFVSRQHPLNRWLGSIRYTLTGQRTKHD